MFNSALILSLLATAIAHPDGSPVCNIVRYSNSPENPHGNHTINKNPSYVLVESFNTSTAFLISKPFKGLLLFVTDLRGRQVGSFSPPSNDFTFVAGCINPRSALTHANPETKSGGVFGWQCPVAGRYLLRGLVHTEAMESFRIPFACSPPTAPNNTVVGGVSDSTVRPKAKEADQASNNPVGSKFKSPIGDGSELTKKQLSVFQSKNWKKLLKELKDGDFKNKAKKLEDLEFTKN